MMGNQWTILQSVENKFFFPFCLSVLDSSFHANCVLMFALTETLVWVESNNANFLSGRSSSRALCFSICRKETRVIFLRNSTLLPVAWRVNGMDNLGDDFSLTTEHGVIDAKSEFALQMHFRAIRPTNIRKIVRLEVSDLPFQLWLSYDGLNPKFWYQASR